MAEEEPREDSLRVRGEDAVAELANALLDNPVLNQALSAALGVGEKAAQAQKRAMDAVGLPSADKLERLERRIRSLSERLEAVEDQLDRVARDAGELRRKLAEEKRAAAAAEEPDLEAAAAAEEPDLEVSEAE